MGSFQGPNFFNVWTSKISNFVRDCLIFLHSNFSPLSLKPPRATFNLKNLKKENFICFRLWSKPKVSANTKNTSSLPGPSLIYNSVIPNLLSSPTDLIPWLTRARYRKLGQIKMRQKLVFDCFASGEYPWLGCQKPVGGSRKKEKWQKSKKTNTGEYRPDWLPRGSQRRKKQIVQDGAALSTPCAKRDNFSYTMHIRITETNTNINT